MPKITTKHRVSDHKSTDIRATLADLTTLDRDTLINHWRTVYDDAPPVNISRPLLLNAITYRMQEKVLGGLNPATRRHLSQLITNDRTATSPPTNLKSGTRLLREWHGTTHEVMVTDDGVRFKGKRYRSLSEVAFTITGTKWSGPLFFGLRRKSNG